MTLRLGRKLMVVVMDGVGSTSHTFGNAIAAAHRPHLRWLERHHPNCTLLAHGTAVGMPSDGDMGNSEVGHNAIGAGRIFAQGAKLVQQAIDVGSLYAGETWQAIVSRLRTNGPSSAPLTLHLIGLLSDGNVHSHELHLHALIRRAKADGIRSVRIHCLLDGRDVGERSAEIYIERLHAVMSDVRSGTFDVRIASGGGRMVVTMDRYESDWSIVERGWKAHVLGEGDPFPSIDAAIKEYRRRPELNDQNLPAFVIVENGKPVGTIDDGDVVICFNFRGDRAIQISRAFSEKTFSYFERKRIPDIYYAGIMQYDGDYQIPQHYLVPPPAISGTLSEVLVDRKVHQFACSETQKFGHVTYFWNGNRSGKVSQESDMLEDYVEIRSDQGISFDVKPWMKAAEICDAAINHMRGSKFQFGRINFANADMVGHTGNFEAAVVAVATVDLMIGRLIAAARETNTILVVTADHGNADEMFDAKSKDYPDWAPDRSDIRPKSKTSHTLNPVPFLVFDPDASFAWKIGSTPRPGLANLAATFLELMGLAPNSCFLPSIIERAR